MSKTSPDVRELLQLEGRNRHQQHREKQFLAAKSPKDNPELFNSVQQLNLLKIQKLPPAKDIEAFQDIINGANKIDELACIEDLAKSLQLFEKAFQGILNQCSSALNANKGILQELPLTQQYQKAIADEATSLKLIISEIIRLLKEYPEKISENYEQRFNRYKVVNRKCAKSIRSLNKLKRVANEYRKQLSILTTVEDQRAFQYIKSINFLEQINLSKSAVETLFSYYYFTKSEIINTKQSIMPVDISIIILRKLTGDDLISLSCLSKAHNTYVKSYRYHMSVAYLNQPASIGWQALDYLSYSEILLYLDIEGDEPLAKLIKEYKKISQEYGQYKYWLAVLADPTVNSFATYIKKYYGLIGLNYESILKLFELNINRQWQHLARDLKSKIDSLSVCALKFTNRFVNRTWRDLINSDDEVALETLIKSVTELKQNAAKIERCLDVEFCNADDLTRVIKLFPPCNGAVTNQFQHVLTLLRDAPCGKRIRIEDINEIKNKDKWKNVIAAILGKPEYSHIYKRYNLDSEFHRYAQPHREEHKLVILDGMRSENHLVINKLTSSILSSLLAFFTEMYDPIGEEAAALILRGIEQGNKLILSKLDSAILELLIKKFHEDAVKTIWECKELHPMFSEKRLKEIEQLNIQYQEILENLQQQKLSIERFVASVRIPGSVSAYSRIVNGSLIQQIEYYKKCSAWCDEFGALPAKSHSKNLVIPDKGFISRLKSNITQLLLENNLYGYNLDQLQFEIRKKIDYLGACLKKRIDTEEKLLNEHLKNIDIVSGMYTAEISADFQKLMECFVNIRDYCYAEFVAFSELPSQAKTRLTREQAKNLHGIWEVTEEEFMRYQLVPDDPKEMLDLFDLKLKTILDAILHSINKAINQLKQSVVGIKECMQSQEYTLRLEADSKWKSCARNEELLIKLINPLIAAIENLTQVNLEFNRENRMRRHEGDKEIPSLLTEFFQKVYSLNADFIDLQSQAQRLRSVPSAISQPLLSPGQEAVQSPVVDSIVPQSNHWFSEGVVNKVRATYTKQSGFGFFSSQDSTELHRKLDLVASHLSVGNAKEEVDKYLLNPTNKGRRLFDILLEEKVCRKPSLQQNVSNNWLTMDVIYLIQQKYNQQRGFKLFGFSCEASLVLLRKLNSSDEISIKQAAIEEYLIKESNKGKRLYNILIDLKNKIESAHQHIPVLKAL